MHNKYLKEIKTQLDEDKKIAPKRYEQAEKILYNAKTKIQKLKDR